jgi:uncharacterized membrane protein
MLVVTLYMKTANEEYKQVREWLKSMQLEIPHKMVEMNISNDPKLGNKIGDNVPVAQVGPYILHWPFTEVELHVSLLAASDRKMVLEKTNDKKYQERIQRGHTLTKADRFSYWFSRNYMAVISFLLLFYVGLPVLAPVFMHYNAVGPAKVIYALYKPFCHQLGFRSVFLYGEQWFYPRELAHLAGYKTYEMITGQDEIDVLEARKFIGNDEAGYKIAFCQRDLAIYGSLWLFSIIYMISGRKIKSIPWYIWVIIGIVPIGLDGISQLPALVSDTLAAWFPARESVPSLRFITGFLFGFTTGWYLFPMLEESMIEISQMMERKYRIVKQLNESN